MTREGRERRIHFIFVTRNTEYHVRNDRCVAVRDRQTGAFHARHVALLRRVGGSVAHAGDGSFTAERGLPAPGQSLLFEGTGTVTSPVLRIERPAKAIVHRYPIVA